jgi:sporulation protein YqfC
MHYIWRKKGKDMSKKRKIAEKIDRMLEIPKEVYTNMPKLSIVGFEEMIVENYKSILEYEDYYVRVNTYIGILNINGFNLRLEKMTNDHIRITGSIENIDLEKTTD